MEGKKRYMPTAQRMRRQSRGREPFRRAFAAPEKGIWRGEKSLRISSGEGKKRLRKGPNQILP